MVAIRRDGWDWMFLSRRTKSRIRSCVGRGLSESHLKTGFDPSDDVPQFDLPPRNIAWLFDLWRANLQEKAEDSSADAAGLPWWRRGRFRGGFR